MHAARSRDSNFRIRAEALVDGLRQWCPMVVMPLTAQPQAVGHARTPPERRASGRSMKGSEPGRRQAWPEKIVAAVIAGLTWCAVAASRALATGGGIGL